MTNDLVEFVLDEKAIAKRLEEKIEDLKTEIKELNNADNS